LIDKKDSICKQEVCIDILAWLAANFWTNLFICHLFIVSFILHLKKEWNY
jgi:hypothetical protein